jgi:hypothetical protein
VGAENILITLDRDHRASKGHRRAHGTTCRRPTVRHGTPRSATFGTRSDVGSGVNVGHDGSGHDARVAGGPDWARRSAR